MPYRERHNGYQVEVNSRKALPGFKRIRVQVQGDEAEAVRVEQEIKEALRVYGQYPVTEGTPALSEVTPARQTQIGTLRLATGLALATHWAGAVYASTVNRVMWNTVSFFEDVRGVIRELL